MKLHEERKLSDICQVKGGYAFKSKDFKTNGIPLVRISNIKNERVEVEEGCVYIAEKYFLNYKEYQVNKGDILIALSGATTGKFGIYELNTPALLNQRVGMIKIMKKDKALSNYIYYYIYSITKKILKEAQGAAQPNISTKNIENFNIALFPISEQKQIVQTLDTADTLRQKRKEQLNLLDDYLKSVFFEMFGDPNDFSEKTVLELTASRKGSLRTGPFGSSLKHSEFVEQGIAVLGIDNAVDNEFKWKKLRYITSEKYEKLKQYTVYPDDVLITIMGTLGRSSVVPKDIPLAINTKHLACITLNKAIVNPYFFSYSITNNPYILHQLQGNTRGAIMGGLNLTIIKNLKFKLPPINLQNEFFNILNMLNETKQKMRASLDEMDNHFNALMQRYFG